MNNLILSQFSDRLPYRPYCTDNLIHGLTIRQKVISVEKKYIQPNPPSARSWLIFDIDEPGAAEIWQDANVPPPTIIVGNPKNKHAHFLYGLNTPVVTSNAGRLAPIRYAAAIENAYKKALGADPGYSGLITKNPLHPYWDTCTPGEFYDLSYLAEWVSLNEHHVGSYRSGLGRNCDIFERLRFWAYREVENFRRQGISVDAWLNTTIQQALSYNEFPKPLLRPEILSIAKSVANWTWQNYNGRLPDEKFSQIQSLRGQKKGKEKRKEGLCLMKENPTLSNAVIAERVGVSRETVYRWRKLYMDSSC